MDDKLFSDANVCPQPPPCETRHVGAQMRILSNMIHRVINHPYSGEEDSISGTNGWILGYLANNEDKEVFQRDLEEIFHVRRATVSKIICLMEQKGLIERQSVAYDARLKKLVLTDKGRRLHDETVAEIAEMEKCLMRNIPEDKLNTFFEVCDMIKQNIADMDMKEEK
jgi:DNA-binding MarR family transcriptional regulator